MLLLREFDEAFGHDFIDRDIVSHSIRLQSINELNSLGNVIRGRAKLDAWLEKTRLSSHFISSDATSGIPFRALKFI